METAEDFLAAAPDAESFLTSSAADIPPGDLVGNPERRLIRPPSRGVDVLGGGKRVPLASASEMVASLGGEPANEWEAINTPLIDIMPEFTPEERARVQREGTKGAKIATGIYEGAAPAVNFFTSPLGIASLGVGVLPRVAQRGIAAIFAAHMASQTPEVARELGKEYAKPEDERDLEKIAQLTTAGGLNALFTVAAGTHAVAPGRVVGAAPLAEVQTYGRDLTMPAGAVPTAEEFLKPPSAGATTAETPIGKPEVPETSAEPYETVLQTLRRVEARTIRQIQQAFPKAELNREQARSLRDLAWPEEAAAREKQKTENGNTNAQQESETAQPNGDVLDTTGTSDLPVGHQPLPADERSAGVPPRGQGQNVQPAPPAPAEDVRSVEAPVTPAVAAVQAADHVREVAAGNGQPTAKAVKSELVTRIETAIEAARQDNPNKPAFVEIDIPGDGHFKIGNTPEQLTEVLTRAQRLSTAPSARATVPTDVPAKAARTRALGPLEIPQDRELTAGDVQAAQSQMTRFEKTVADAGWKDTSELPTSKDKLITALRESLRSPLRNAPPTVGAARAFLQTRLGQMQKLVPAAASPKTFSMATSAPGPSALRPAPPTTRVIPPSPLPPAVTAAGATAPVVSHFTRVRQAFQSLFSPQNIDPTAKQFSYILRENNAKAALDLVRADAQMAEVKSYFDKSPVPKDWAYDPAQPLPFNFAVMDALERNRAALPAALHDFGRVMDGEFKWRIAEVRALKPGAMQQLIQNYFPHLWENPKQGQVVSLMAEVAARSPFHGSKGFLEQRSLPLTVDGMARGLRPISDNPVDLVLAKLHQMDKFLMAAKTMQEAKGNGMLKYFPIGREIPSGRTVVDDPAFTVYAPPFLEVREAFDAGVRLGLMDFIKKMGWTHQRLASLGVNVWGQYVQGGEVKSRFGAPDFVIMHEIGHGLEERYGLSRDLLATDVLRNEMSKLADLRNGAKPKGPKFQKYIQSVDEQVANAVHAYIYAPDLMAKVAPTAQKVLAGIIKQHPELGDLESIKPGVALESAKSSLPLAGPVLAGRWTLPDGAAQVLTNFLSPGLGRFAPFRTLRAASNILNGAQLGLSGFHVGFTSLDAVVSSVATGLGYALRGELFKAARSMAFAPVAPVANYYVGKAVQMKMVDPLATHVPVLDFPKVGIRGFQAGLSPTAEVLTRQIAELAVKGGLRAETDPFWKTSITRNLLRAVHEGGVVNYAKAGLRLPWAVVEQSMRPIAEYLVPRQKLGVFAQLAMQEMERVGWNAAPDQVRAGMARAADATEDRMGQMTYDNLFYNKTIKDISLLAFRAYGWQLGKYRHMFGAMADTATLLKNAGEKSVSAVQGKPSSTPPLEITNRMLYPVALTMVAAAAGAITHRLLTGQNPQTLTDYILPWTGQVDAQGKKRRLSLPTYLKDLMADWKDFPSLSKMGANFYHKLNPWVATTADMLRNQDYYGVEIRHPDDPLAQQMKALTTFAVKQFIPFSISGTMKLHEENSPIGQLVLPFFGIVPAKKALTMTTAETLAADLMRDSLPAGSRTREQWDHGQMLKTLVRDLRSNAPKGVVIGAPQLDPAARSQLKPDDARTIVSMLTLTPLQYQVHKLSAPDAMRVWRLASPEEQRMLQPQLAMKVANSRTLPPEKLTAYLRELHLNQPQPHGVPRK